MDAPGAPMVGESDTSWRCTWRARRLWKRRRPWGTTVARAAHAGSGEGGAREYGSMLLNHGVLEGGSYEADVACSWWCGSGLDSHRRGVKW
jgi:hypothetical protein